MNELIKKRPCRVEAKIWDKETRKQIDLIFDGLFHGWGSEAEDGGEHGFGNFTVAIVEDENGRVFTINPNCIKFTDKK